MPSVAAVLENVEATHHSKLDYLRRVYKKALTHADTNFAVWKAPTRAFDEGITYQSQANKKAELAARRKSTRSLTNSTTQQESEPSN